MKIEEDLEAGQQREWSYGLEIYYRHRTKNNAMELMIVYFNSKQRREIWVGRLDKIIYSNKSAQALRLQRSGQSRERPSSRSTSTNRATREDRAHSAPFARVAAPINSEVISQEQSKLSSNAFSCEWSHRLPHKLPSQFDLVDVREPAVVPGPGRRGAGSSAEQVSKSSPRGEPQLLDLVVDDVDEHAQESCDRPEPLSAQSVGDSNSSEVLDEGPRVQHHDDDKGVNTSSATDTPSCADINQLRPNARTKSRREADSKLKSPLSFSRTVRLRRGSMGDYGHTK